MIRADLARLRAQHSGGFVSSVLFDANLVRGWLDSPSPGAISYPDVAGELARWLAAGADESVASLSRRLWARTLFPEEVSDRLSELDGGDCLSSCWLSQVSVVD